MRVNRRKFMKSGSLLALPWVLPKQFLNLNPAINTDLSSNSSSSLKYNTSNKSASWHLLSKVTYWPVSEDLKLVKKKGFENYIQEQLNAPLEDDKDVQKRIENLMLDIKYEYNGYTVDEKRPVTYLDKDLTFCRKEFEKIEDRGWNEWIRPGMEVASANWLRAVYSPYQLREMMVEFWHNHFNVTVNGNMSSGFTIPHYDKEVIRKNAFGNFRMFLGDVAKSPAMLYYLDNKSSKASPANENYARELFELHTLGQEHYYNHLYDRWQDVPGAENGKPEGYIDEDVYEAARAFTGWTVADGAPFWRSAEKEELPNDGKFYYFEVWHDNYQKRILGHHIKSHMPPLYDGEKVLDLVAKHPGTAKNICKKLLVRFLGEDYSEELLTKATTIFLSNTEAPDQIKKTLEGILTSEEFLQYKGQKVKRPYEYIVSAARATKAEFTPNMMLHWICYNMGYKPFMWPAPTGHPDEDLYWMGPGAMLSRWKTASSIHSWKEFGVFEFDLAKETPSGLTNEEIVDFWSEKVTGSVLQENYRKDVLVAFSGEDSPLSKPELSKDELETRLLSLSQFLISTPDFQIR